MVYAVEARDLSREYAIRGTSAPVHALRGISLQVQLGSVQGLLGPNGAGKTTLTKILSTVLLPSAGHASVLGHDVVTDTAAVRREIGVVLGGDRGLYQRLSARHNLEYWAALYRVPKAVAQKRIPELLERVGLQERADVLVDTYSRGMKQRLHLARGLIADARVLLLDEPTIGMDPLAALEFRQLVKDLRAAGKSILLTTHDMEEAEEVCDSVALIDHGRLLAIETPAALAELVTTIERIDFSSQDATLPTRLRARPGIASVHELKPAHARSADFRIELTHEAAMQDTLAFLVSQGVTSLRTSRPSLAEVYRHVIGDRGLTV